MIRNLGSRYSFVQESIQGKISKSIPTNATPVKKRLLETPDLQIGSSVIAYSKNKQWKVFPANLGIWAGKASNI